jgi:DNA-binding phage protein
LKLTLLFRYLHTIAYLTLQQIAYQLIRRFRPEKILPQVTGHVRLRSDLSMTEPLHRRMREEENTFTFLNLTKRFGGGLAGIDWASPDAEYLNAALADPNQEVFLLALRDVIAARDGMSELAGKATLNRVSLYRSLSKRGQPGTPYTQSDAYGVGLQPCH